MAKFGKSIDKTRCKFEEKLVDIQKILADLDINLQRNLKANLAEITSGVTRYMDVKTVGGLKSNLEISV